MGFTVKCLFIVNADSLLYITVVLGLHNCVDIVAFLLLPARFVVLRVPFSPDVYSHLSFDILEPNLIDFISILQHFGNLCMLKSKLHILMMFSFILSESFNWYYWNSCFVWRGYEGEFVLQVCRIEQGCLVSVMHSNKRKQLLLWVFALNWISEWLEYNISFIHQ